MQEVARNAVRALRGIRLCAEGHEEGRLTHLVLGQQRRTLKACCACPMLVCAVLCSVLFWLLRLSITLSKT